MFTVLLPLGDNPIAVNKYIISYIFSFTAIGNNHMVDKRNCAVGTTLATVN